MLQIMLLVALLVPVAVFLFLQGKVVPLRAAFLSVLVGWLVNIVYFRTVGVVPGKDSTAVENVQMAIRFGWVCPLIAVAITCLVTRFTGKRA